MASVRTARRALFALVTLAVPACLTDSAGFVCTSDGACRTGQHCVASSCASADGACPSGYRWDDTSGDRSGQCAVDEQDAQIPDPNCGNGTLEQNEKCDDGPGSPTPCPTAADCDDHEPCTDDLITGQGCQQICTHEYHPEGEMCGTDAGTGTCAQHACCTGCLEGTRCTSGDQPGSCGTGGGTCGSCVVDGGGCQSSYCQAGGCASQVAGDQTPCPGGLCASGACCTGCVTPTDGGITCHPGTANGNCGSDGVECAACQFGCLHDGGDHCANCMPSCQGKTCGSDGCGGTCGLCPLGQVCAGVSCMCIALGNEDNDVQCSDGRDNNCNNKIDCADPNCNTFRCNGMAKGNFCVGPNCLVGCRIGGSFFPDKSDNPGNTCQYCDITVDDSAWTTRPDLTSCKSTIGVAGLCHSGSCCGSCWDGQSCRDSNTGHCGLGGVACVNCNDSNACTDNLCTNGVCSNPPLPDGTFCHPLMCASGPICQGCPDPTSPCRTGGSCQGGNCNVVVANVDCCTALMPHCCVVNNVPTCCP